MRIAWMKDVNNSITAVVVTVTLVRMKSDILLVSVCSVAYTCDLLLFAVLLLLSAHETSPCN